ncbi:hypothetical protein GEV33_001991 [Tenebrio molitor]|uniref:Uncharacterized protein n=1 Tax=Tenebrio molitor TaxID=7067 RepID=A0A8J6HU61_TENMO|nr:hypothetical protein GEV33_001991 [Tenebrio molitor]
MPHPSPNQGNFGNMPQPSQNQGNFGGNGHPPLNQGNFGGNSHPRIRGISGGMPTPRTRCIIILPVSNKDPDFGAPRRLPRFGSAKRYSKWDRQSALFDDRGFGSPRTKFALTRLAAQPPARRSPTESSTNSSSADDTFFAIPSRLGVARHEMTGPYFPLRLSTFFNHYLEVEDVCELFDLILYTNQKFDFEAEKEQIVFEEIKKKLSKTVMKNVLLFSLFSKNVMRPPMIGKEPVNTKMRVLREGILKFDVTIFSKKSEDLVKSIWAFDSNELLNDTQAQELAVDYQLTFNDQTILLWLMDRYPLLVVDSVVTRKVINLSGSKKFVLFSDNDNIDNFTNLSVLRKLSDLEKHPFKIIENNDDTTNIKKYGKFQLIEDQDDFGVTDTAKMKEYGKPSDIMRSFKFILKVGVDESIVNAPRITDHGSTL